MIDVKVLHSINPLLMVYVYFFKSSKLSKYRIIFSITQVLMPNLNSYFFRLILNLTVATELFQTLGCTFLIRGGRVQL